MADAPGGVALSRRRALAVTFLGTLLIWGPQEFDAPTVLVWNATASAPIGLYRVDRSRSPRPGDRVLVAPDARMSALLDQRGYVPAGVPLIKTVAALAPARVCRHGSSVTIGGRFAAKARAFDRQGRPLPAWSGCRTLSPTEVFLLTAEAPDSLDGRYFGPLPKGVILGRAIPVWMREPTS